MPTDDADVDNAEIVPNDVHVITEGDRLSLSFYFSNSDR